MRVVEVVVEMVETVVVNQVILSSLHWKVKVPSR